MVNKKVTKTNEQTFYDILKAFFVGPLIEGQGGFAKLFKARQSYYQKLVTVLQQEIEKHNGIKEDIYGLLNEFLSFSANQYSFWDMQKWFYYVKTDVIFQSIGIEAYGFKFFFDAEQVSYKKNNEKRSIAYELKEAKENTITFLVYYKEGNLTTDITSILDAIGDKITEPELRKVFKKYERKIKQTERDFFIHKDVRNFLREKLKLWLGQYVYNNELTQDTTMKFQTAKEIIHKLIDLVGTFEDEILRLWNTPKSEINVNYVITLDRIAEHRNRGLQIIDMILNHKNVKEQIKEWQVLGIVDNGFSVKNIKSNFEKYKYLPIDTKYFKDIEHNILNLFDNLDNALDGLLIKSENYQALNTLLPKFKEKVQTIYIDPPFNLASSDKFLYRTNYKDSTWATLLENRLRLAKDWLNDKGSIFVRCDYNGNWIVRCVMDEIFGKENFRNEIIIQRGLQTRKAEKRFLNKTDSLFFYLKNSETGLLSILEIEKEHVKSYRETLDTLKKLLSKEEYQRIEELLNKSLWMPFLSMPGEQKTTQYREIFGIKLFPPKGRHWAFSQENLNIAIKEDRARLKCTKCGFIITNNNRRNFDGKCPQCKGENFVGEILSLYNQISNNWTDIPGYEQDPDFPTKNSEILLKRV
jgi:Adenine specific DNA methylase Mod